MEKGTKKKIFTNFFSLSFGQTLSQVITFITVAYMARILGPESLGKIGFAQVFTSYFNYLTDMGLCLLGIREIALDRSKIPAYVDMIVSIKAVFAAFSFIALAATAFLITKPQEIKLLILIYGAAIFMTATALDWFYLGIERMELTGIVNTLRAAAFLGLLFVFVKVPSDIFNAAWGFLASYAVSTALYFVLARVFAGYSYKFRFELKAFKEIVRKALPLGALVMLNVFIQQQSILVLGFLRSPVEVGLYFGIFKVVFAAIFVIGMFADSVYPVFSYTRGNAVVFYCLKIVLPAFMPIGLLGTVFDKETISLLLGRDFLAGSEIFRLLLWSLPLTAMISVFSKALIARRHDWKCLLGFAIGLGASIVSSLYLIPAHGLTGAAVSYLISLGITALHTGYYALRLHGAPAAGLGAEETVKQA